MLTRFRRLLLPVARTLTGVLVSLWMMAAASPCVMAQSNHDHAAAALTHHAAPDGADHAAMLHGDTEPCSPATVVDCKFRDFASPTGTATIGDLSIQPVLLAMLPVAPVLPRAAMAYEHALRVPDIPAPPLPILHSALLL